MNDLRRILFIRTDRIGDALMNLPAIRVLRKAFPKAWVTAMVAEGTAPLFLGHPDVDEVLVTNTAELRSVPGLLRLSRRLRRAHFDAAIVSNPDKNLHALTFLAGIPFRAGYGRKWGFLLTHRLPDKKDRALHEIEYDLELTKLVTPVPWDGRIVLTRDELAAKSVRALLKKEAGEGPLIALHAGSSNPKKMWPAARFVELCHAARTLGDYRLALIGGEEEKALSRDLAARAKMEVLDWTGRLSLPELSELFASGRVKALVSSDSGPVHIAWMSDVPVVAMYAKDVPGSDPVRWGPRDAKSICLHKNMGDITSEEVFEALKKVLRNDP